MLRAENCAASNCLALGMHPKGIEINQNYSLSGLMPVTKQARDWVQAATGKRLWMD